MKRFVLVAFVTAAVAVSASAAAHSSAAASRSACGVDRWTVKTFNAPQDYLFPTDKTWGWAGNFNVSYHLPKDVLVEIDVVAIE